MKTIQATPKDVEEIFASSYIIPDFQRRYSWEQEHCETLWDDVVGFHELEREGNSKEKYFLGNIVVHPDLAGDKKYAVIDGQQRLTTLMLLIKAMHTRAATAIALENCLRVQDKIKKTLTDELKIVSEVIAEDRDVLKRIVFDQIEVGDENLLVANYRFFVEKIDEWRAEPRNNSVEAFERFIETLLYRIVLLPIECETVDDALTIFETINNRGKSLSDADIFKAKLYHVAPKDRQNELIDDWNILKNHDWLFRLFMHVSRAEKNDTGNEIGLRSYYITKNHEPLANWSETMNSIMKINAVSDWLNDSEWSIVKSLWGIMRSYPNQIWNYPLFVFLHKHGCYSRTDGFNLAEEYREPLERLLEETVRYNLIKGVVYNSGTVIKDTIFRVCAKIAQEDDYLNEHRQGITQSDYGELHAKLFKKNSNLKRYQRGIILLSAYLNPHQDKRLFAELIWGKCDIEHILPKAWNNYDGWTNEEYKTYLNSIGNLIPLEKAKNIKAKNEYLQKKKEYYKTSCVQDALDILDIADSGWTPDQVKTTHLKKVKRLMDFFDPDNMLENNQQLPI